MSVVTGARRARQIGPAGTTARVVAGAALLLNARIRGVKSRDLAVGLVGAPAVVSSVLGVRRALVGASPVRATGVPGHVANLGLIGASFARAPSVASVFYGSSLLVAAVRGYAACEVFAITNWLFDRDDQVGCPAFFVVDHVETRQADDASVLSSTWRSWRNTAAYGACRSAVGDIAP